VYDFIWVDDFHLFLGSHIHSERLLPEPGNIPSLVVPASAPSRAWLKLEEAILRFRPVVQPGWKALEIGCAPGGATTALLDRGFTVTGIDPQFMEASVIARGGFTHVRKPARFATPDDLRLVNPDWIVMDMSIPPKDALGELSHVIHTLRGLWGKDLGIRRGFLTIKLNDWKYASEIPDYLKRLGQIGFQDLSATQLANNRQEFFVYSPKFRI
jgi:23S rRNA (cytidine2498-2'-O)-methyltransferase